MNKTLLHIVVHCFASCKIVKYVALGSVIDRVSYVLKQFARHVQTAKEHDVSDVVLSR